MSEMIKQMLCLELRTLLREFDRLSEKLDTNDSVSMARWREVGEDIQNICRQLDQLELEEKV